MERCVCGGRWLEGRQEAAEVCSIVMDAAETLDDGLMRYAQRLSKTGRPRSTASPHPATT